MTTNFKEHQMSECVDPVHGKGVIVLIDNPCIYGTHIAYKYENGYEEHVFMFRDGSRESHTKKRKYGFLKNKEAVV